MKRENLMFNPLTINAELKNLAVQSPLLIVYLVGFILALVRWRHHPRASLLTVIGSLTAIVIYVFFSVASPLFADWIISTSSTRSDIETYFTALAIGRILLHAVGMSLILAAVFVSRPQSHRFQRLDDPNYPLPDELTRPGANPVDDTVYQRGQSGA